MYQINITNNFVCPIYWTLLVIFLNGTEGGFCIALFYFDFLSPTPHEF